MTDERDQQERFLDKQYQEEKVYLQKWETFKSDAVERVQDCLGRGGDLIDLLNTLDLEFDEYDGITSEQICEIVLAATQKKG